MTVVALVCVAGPPSSTVSVGAGSVGAGSGGAEPAWADLDGQPLLWHAVRRLREAGVARVALVVHERHAERARAAAADPELGGTVTVTVADGRLSGAREALALTVDSVRAAGPDVSVVLVHDPTRAFAPVAMIRRVIDGVLAGAGVVVPVLPVVDTIRAVGTDGQASALVDRDALRIVQSPQAFSPEVLRRVYEHADSHPYRDGAVGDEATPDEAALATATGQPLTTVPGHADAARVLTSAELDNARRGLGYVASVTIADHRAPEKSRG